MNKALCYSHRDREKTVPSCATCQRIAIEHRIVRKTVKALLDAGYALNTNNGGDDDELPAPTKTAKDILAVLVETDDEFLKVFAAADTFIGWVRFVYGNDGYDVISDYTTNLEEVLKPINDYADTLA